MRAFSSSLGSTAGTVATLLALAHPPSVAAINFTSVPSPHLDLAQLGRVALAGSFDALSIYQWEGQQQSTYSTNGSQSILARFPNGAFTSISNGDAHIEAMCPFVTQDGTMTGIVVGGNFTSLGGVEAQGIALFNPNTSEITPLPGLSGSVQSLYCDADSGTVYVGGSFSGGNSTNALAWVDGWTNLPFAGFNGAVSSIAKASDGNIIFGGSFTGLGNTTAPKDKDQQVVPIAGANITSVGTSSLSGFDDPSNIICKTGTDQGSGNTWLLEDGTAGSWTATFGFGFEPTKLRLYNTDYNGRGTKTFRFTAMPINGIMNLTYIDSDGNNATCDARCSLPQGNTTYQDFHFVNQVGMNAFRIDISDWYGDGGGLDGIELFQNDIYSYAINEFNQPKCDDVSIAANATATGPWSVTPSHDSNSEYLTADLTGSDISSSAAQVVFKPYIEQAGNYSVLVYTPGCKQDDTCDNRGIVNITGTMTAPGSSTSQSEPLSTELYQTNYYDKYDTVYNGYVDAADDSFRPSVTLTPASGQSGSLTVVAQRVRWVLQSSTSGGLNGLYEYNPNLATVSDDFSSSAVDVAGTSLDDDAVINQLIVDGSTIYVAGNFSASNYSNIFSISDNKTTSLAGSGLNQEVVAMYLNGTSLYVGGNFTNTQDNTGTDLNGVAVYDTSKETWTPLGAGVDGVVTDIVPFKLNLTDHVPEYVLGISGLFEQVMKTDTNASFAADGIAIWVPSRGNWLNNLLDISAISLSGHMSAYTEVPGSDPLFAGSVASQSLAASGAVGLDSAPQGIALDQLPIRILPSTSSSTSNLVKRSALQSNMSGVVTGIVYDENNLNITVMGGHFTALASNGSEIRDLLLVNSSDSNTVTGLTDELNSDATILSLDFEGTTLYAGGTFSGNASGDQMNGLLAYNLKTGRLANSQPQALSRDSGEVNVNAIATRPKSSDVYVGGDFDSAGSFGCPALCVLATDRGQWTNPGNGLSGSISVMSWISDNTLAIGGNLTIDNNATTLATYSSKSKTYTAIGGGDAVPGPVTAFTMANSDGSQFWVAGTATNGSAFLMLSTSDGSSWQPASSGLGDGTVIRNLQIFSTTQDHDSSDLMDKDEVLMILGEIRLPSFGNASAVVYNGTDYVPFILASNSDNGQGSLSSVFVQNAQNVFKSGGNHLALGLVVLIALAISLALIMLIVVAGIVAERIRRKNQGYMPAPTQMGDKGGNMSRIPPADLLGNLNSPGHAERL
ncbi:cellular morphogenesis protein [Saccharata proteae CBS 121410]|uniref:Cellular morphogenesis protein n=1 Tax=Saccharata proteae CBS 121410 TaxID=1314787 RepID=A0A9P4HWV7_9PEZI|nr:cellular morphogenesis protein [Saccharata proteae CBS 121410]